MAKVEDKLINLKDLKIVYKAVFKGWYLLILAPLVFGFIGAFISYKKTPEYTSQLQLLLESNDIYDYQASINRSVGMQYTDISNQIRVLRSYDLIQKVVDKLDLDVTYYTVGRINTMEVFWGMPFKVELKSFDPRLVNERIHVEIMDETEFELKFEFDGEVIINKHHFNEDIITPWYVINVTSSRLVESVEADYEIEFHKKDYWVNKVKAGLEIVNQEYTTILNVSLVDEIPARSLMILDTLAKVYLSYTLQNQFEINENTLLYIDKQLGEVIDLMDSIASEMDTLRVQKDVLDLGRETEELFSGLFGLSDRIEGNKRNIQSLTHLQEYVENSTNDNLLPPAMYVLKQDAYLNKALGEFYSNQIKMIQMKAMVTQDHMGYKELGNQIMLQRMDLLIYLGNSIQAFEIEQKDLQDEYAVLESKIKKLPKTGRELKDVERIMQINEKLYVYLLEKRANTVIAKSGIVPRTKVIEKARVVAVVGGDYFQRGIYFALIGLVIGILLSIVKYWLFNTYETLGDLKEDTELPVYGGIPFQSGMQSNEVDTSSKSWLMESLRGIRTSLSYSSVKDGNLFVVTSIHPGEGKTFVSGSLASLYAQSGKKVLIVDFDLHKPRLHKFFAIDNHSGNSNFLSGQAELEHLILKKDENLHVLTSGLVPPNPSELVLSEKVNEIIEFGRSNYDYVFLDSPPIGVISDAIVLMNKVDMTLFVMNAQMANKKGLKYLESIVNDVGIKNKGIILNGIKFKRWRYQYGRYGYGYGYGYGYTYGEKQGKG